MSLIYRYLHIPLFLFKTLTHLILCCNYYVVCVPLCVKMCTSMYIFSANFTAKVKLFVLYDLEN